MEAGLDRQGRLRPQALPLPFGGLVLWLVLLFMVGCTRSDAVDVPVDTDINSDGATALPARLFRPDGAGPFPAVVLLHGCAGLLPKHEDWAETLADWGYVALVIDSFSTRRVDRICEADNAVWARFRALRQADAHAALRYLGQQPFVDPSRIGVIGWSNGGTIVLDLVAKDSAFRAAVAFYPSCWQFQQESGLNTLLSLAPTLVLMGRADDWTRPRYCQALFAGREAASLRLYDGAYHDFDNRREPLTIIRNVRVEGGGNGRGDVTVGFDAAAYRAAKVDLRQFLDERL